MGLEEIQDRFFAEKLYNAVNYAQQCYNTSNSSGDESSVIGCNKYVVSCLPTAIANYTSECPFQNDSCRDTQSTLRLDSGYVDTNNELGLNTPQNARLAIRYVLQCVPLKAEDYTSHAVRNDRGWNRYHYGNRSNGSTNDSQAPVLDYIYEIEDINSQYPNKSSSLSSVSFKLGQVFD